MRTKELQELADKAIIAKECLNKLEVMPDEIQIYVSGQIMELYNSGINYSFFLEDYYYHMVDDNRGLHQFKLYVQAIGQVLRDYPKAGIDYVYKVRSIFTDDNTYCTIPVICPDDHVTFTVLYEA